MSLDLGPLLKFRRMFVRRIWFGVFIAMVGVPVSLVQHGAARFAFAFGFGAFGIWLAAMGNWGREKMNREMIRLRDKYQVAAS